MRPIILLPGILIIGLLFSGCISGNTGGNPAVTPTAITPIVEPVTTLPTPSGTVTGIPLVTPEVLDIPIRASPEKYSPYMSSTVGIGLTPVYNGTTAVVYSWNASYGYFISWNAPDWTVNRQNATVETTNQTIYWSYSPEDMGKEKPPVTIRLVIKTPPRVHGGNGTIAWKDIHITWENTDTAAIAPAG